MGWETAQICDECWQRRQNGWEPHRIRLEYRERTRCALCRQFTESGIYLRVETVELPE